VTDYIDLQFRGSDRVIATAVLTGPDGVTLVDPGPSSCLPALEGRVLSAVWRVAPCRRSTGTPSGYALRFLVEPAVPVSQSATPLVEAIAV